MQAALACNAAALVLLVPGALLPAMSSDLLSATREARAVDGAWAFWVDGGPLMAAFVLGLVFIAPFVRALLLVLVLGALRLDYTPSWAGRLFRQAEDLRVWSLPEVYVLAGLVAYGRIAAQLDAEVLAGGWCLVAAACLLLLGDASLDRARVWRAIRPSPGPGRPAAGIGCRACGFIAPASQEGADCPRCWRTLRRREPEVLQRTGAVLLAGLALYPAGLLLPMTWTQQPNGLVERNIIDGMVELFTRGFWYFGIVVFTASVAIPLVKLVALGWLMFRIRRPARRGLVLRTRVHRVIDEINRWSFVDPLIVAVTAPVMAYPALADVHAGPGALPFALVVVLTMLGSRFLDSRLMWDAAEAKHD